MAFGLCGHVQIVMFRWNEGTLSGYAFVDARFYVTALNAVREYLLFGDFYKSVHLCVWEVRVCRDFS